MPAIVLDTGAPAARVRASGAGLVVDDAAQAAAALERLAAEPTALAELAAAARRAAACEPTAAAIAELHRAVYGDMLRRLVPRPADPPYGAGDRALFRAHQDAAR